MIKPALRPALLALVALPLALGLTACKKSSDSASGGASSSAPAAATTPPAGKQWSDVVAKTADGNGMVMGNPNAAIKVVEYGSLSCPHCAKLAEEAMGPLKGTYIASGKVSYEYRSFAIHPQDIPLTVLVRCAGPDAYFGMVEQVYANFDAMNTAMGKGLDKAKAAMSLPAVQRYGALSDALGYTDFFAARGLPVDQQHQCLANMGAAEAVAKESEAISAKGIDSTPTMFVNGTKVAGAEWKQLEAAIKAAGA
jgi:protein-disulfide isomerase